MRVGGGALLCKTRADSLACRTAVHSWSCLKEGPSLVKGPHPLQSSSWHVLSGSATSPDVHADSVSSSSAVEPSEKAEQKATVMCINRKGLGRRLS